jgi:hypothetical protein
MDLAVLYLGSHALGGIENIVTVNRCYVLQRQHKQITLKLVLIPILIRAFIMLLMLTAIEYLCSFVIDDNYVRDVIGNNEVIFCRSVTIVFC